MLATSGPLPPEDGRWAVEVKWDGWRALVTVDGAVTVHTRRGRNATSSFPELAGMANALRGRQVVLDGELVAARDGALDFRPGSRSTLWRKRKCPGVAQGAVAAASFAISRCRTTGAGRVGSRPR
jgi:hypothetical protein